MMLADQTMVRLARSHAGSLKYLEKQGRFRKMNIEQLNQLQAWVDAKWQEYVRRAEG